MTVNSFGRRVERLPKSQRDRTFPIEESAAERAASCTTNRWHGRSRNASYQGPRETGCGRPWDGQFLHPRTRKVPTKTSPVIEGTSTGSIRR